MPLHRRATTQPIGSIACAPGNGGGPNAARCAPAGPRGIRADRHIVLRVRDRGLAARCVTDPHASGLSFLSLVLWIMGYPDQALRTAREASRCAAELSHANTTGHITCHAGGRRPAPWRCSRDARLRRCGYDTRGRARYADAGVATAWSNAVGLSPSKAISRTVFPWCAGACRKARRARRRVRHSTISGFWPVFTRSSATRSAA